MTETSGREKVLTPQQFGEDACAKWMKELAAVGYHPSIAEQQAFSSGYTAAALRTHTGDSAAQSERAGLDRAARFADEWNWRHRSVTNQPCPDDFHSSLGDAIRALSTARKAGGE